MSIIYSPYTKKKYKGEVSFGVHNGKGQVFIDNSLLITYYGCKEIEEVAELFKEDYEVRE